MQYYWGFLLTSDFHESILYVILGAMSIIIDCLEKFSHCLDTARNYSKCLGWYMWIWNEPKISPYHFSSLVMCRWIRRTAKTFVILLRSIPTLPYGPRRCDYTICFYNFGIVGAELDSHLNEFLIFFPDYSLQKISHFHHIYNSQFFKIVSNLSSHWLDFPYYISDIY